MVYEAMSRKNAPGKKLTQRSIFGGQKLDLGPYLGLGQGLGLGPIFTNFFTTIRAGIPKMLTRLDCAGRILFSESY